MKKNKGISLVEMVISIVIMGVLIGLLVPILVRNINKSRTQVCVSNRDNLRREIDIELITRTDINAEDIFREIYIDGSNYDKGCPAKDEYSFKWIDKDAGTFKILCSKHEEAAQSLGDSNVIDKIMEIMQAQKVSNLDSGAVELGGSFSNTVYSQLQALGISFGNMNVGSWSYRKGSTKADDRFYFTPVDISTMKGDGKTSIPVICYDPTLKTYTVYTTKLTTSSTSSASSSEDKNKKYTAIDTNSKQAYTPSTTDKEHQTYSDALKYYNELLKSQE